MEEDEGGFDLAQHGQVQNPHSTPGREREELEIAVELEKLRNQQELAELLEAGDMKEFYRLAN